MGAVAPAAPLRGRAAYRVEELGELLRVLAGVVGVRQAGEAGGVLDGALRVATHSAPVRPIQ